MKKVDFRIWDYNDKRMIYDIDSIEFNSNEAVKIIDKENNFYFTQQEGCLKSCDLMQFICEFDKNGKKIYEGDVLLVNLETKEYIEIASFENKHRIVYEKCEIISNIYEK